ncbi:MAG TPA: zinc-ribbon domain-containing protein [Nitrospira sp.]|nr:zinc-ribbon domain-containing protein [Nitrospira sp.]
MRRCPQCGQQNEDVARYCHQCGTNLTGGAPPQSAPSGDLPDTELWREFIGPNADRYLEQFRKFGSEQAPKFALTWNWPAFLFVSFLWFLYRKMYLYALVYAIGPMISTYLTGDITVGIVWSIMAGATGNYVYYWHCREQIKEISRKAGGDPARRGIAVKEAGGVQAYVIWVGVAFYVLFIMMMVKVAQEGLLDEERLPTKPAKPASSISA